MAMWICTATLQNATVENRALQRIMQVYDLPQAIRRDYIVIMHAEIDVQFYKVPYPYAFQTTDVVLDTLRDLLHAGMYVWDTRAMVVILQVQSTGKGKSGDDDDNGESATKKTELTTECDDE